MTQETGIDHFVSAIREILEETFDTHHGHYLDEGTSLFETLATVSATEASIPVSASCASIAAQINHTTFYLDILRQAMAGDELKGLDWKEAWAIGPVNDEEWKALIGRLRTSADQTMTLLKSTTDWSEDAAYGAVSIAVHTAYHLGEIRQALCTIQNRPPTQVKW